MTTPRRWRRSSASCATATPAHYRVVCLGSAERRCAPRGPRPERDRRRARARRPVAADGTTGSELLDGVRRSPPARPAGAADRLGRLGRTPTGEAIFDGDRPRPDRPLRAAALRIARRAASTSDLQHAARVGGGAPSGAVHRSTSSASRGRAGPTSCGRSSQQCALPHHFCLADSAEGRALVAAAGDGASSSRSWSSPTATSCANPTNAEIAVAAGSPVSPETPSSTSSSSAAGPAGLSAAVYGASEGLSTLVVDQGGIGGQATSSSLIRNYLGFPRGVSGRRLARQAYEQAWVFGAELRLHAARHRPRARGRPAARHPLRRRCRSAPPRCCSPPVPRYRRLGVPRSRR